MIDNNDIIVLDVSEASMEDITILQRAINQINKDKVRVRSKWLEDFDDGLVG